MPSILTDALKKASSLVEEVAPDNLYQCQCCFTHSFFGEITHLAMLDAGASDSFISLDVVRELRLKLLPLKYTIDLKCRQLSNVECGSFRASSRENWRHARAIISARD